MLLPTSRNLPRFTAHIPALSVSSRCPPVRFVDEEVKRLCLGASCLETGKLRLYLARRLEWWQTDPPTGPRDRAAWGPPRRWGRGGGDHAFFASSLWESGAFLFLVLVFASCSRTRMSTYPVMVSVCIFALGWSSPWMSRPCPEKNIRSMSVGAEGSTSCG